MSIEEGDGKAREVGIMFIETSAKAGFNIKVNNFRCSSSLFSYIVAILGFPKLFGVTIFSYIRTK